MIEKLTGICCLRTENGLVIDVGGVGYGVAVPFSSLGDFAPSDETVELWIHTHVREGAINLYGFKTYEERLVFTTMLTINGVGPKLALAILSTLDAATLRQVVLAENTAMLKAVPGVGARIAQRIILELKPKLEKLPSSLFPMPGIDADRTGYSAAGSYKGGDSPLLGDLRSALNNLGYRDRDINPVINRLGEGAQVAELSVLIRKALVELQQGAAGKQDRSRSSSPTPEELF